MELTAELDAEADAQALNAGVRPLQDLASGESPSDVDSAVERSSRSSAEEALEANGGDYRAKGMTPAILKALCDGRGIKYAKRATRAQLIAKLEAADNAAAERDASGDSDPRPSFAPGDLVEVNYDDEGVDTWEPGVVTQLNADGTVEVHMEAWDSEEEGKFLMDARRDELRRA